MLDEQRNIKAFADNLTADLNMAVKDLRQQILNWENEQERIRREEQRRIEEERRAKEEEIRKQAEDLKKRMESETIKAEELDSLTNEVTALNDLKAMENDIKSTPASKNVRYVWDYEITDANLIPRLYLSVDESKIKAAIKLDVREIPGVRIFQKPLLHLR